MAAKLGADAAPLRPSSAARPARCCARCSSSCRSSCAWSRPRGSSGCYLHDRRSGEREPLADERPGRRSPATRSTTSSRSPARRRSTPTCSRVCGPFPAEALPLEVYGNLVADVRANGTPVDRRPLAAPPRQRPRGQARAGQDQRLGAGRATSPGRSTRRSGCEPAAERLLEAGAGAAIITRAEEPALVVRDGRRLGAGPAALRARLARGLRRLDDGRARGLHGGRAASGRRRCGLGAAAGAANFLRHGLGSGRRERSSRTWPGGSSCAPLD